MGHTDDNHDAIRGYRIQQGAAKFLDTLDETCDGTRAVLVTLEPCGCIRTVSSLGEPEKSGVLMFAASQEKPKKEDMS